MQPGLFQTTNLLFEIIPLEIVWLLWVQCLCLFHCCVSVVQFVLYETTICSHLMMHFDKVLSLRQFKAVIHFFPPVRWRCPLLSSSTHQMSSTSCPASRLRTWNSWSNSSTAFWTVLHRSKPLPYPPLSSWFIIYLFMYSAHCGPFFPHFPLCCTILITPVVFINQACCLAF